MVIDSQQCSNTIFKSYYRLPTFRISNLNYMCKYMCEVIVILSSARFRCLTLFVLLMSYNCQVLVLGSQCAPVFLLSVVRWSCTNTGFAVCLISGTVVFVRKICGTSTSLRENPKIDVKRQLSCREIPCCNTHPSSPCFL
jgi:hypothetical protein